MSHLEMAMTTLIKTFNHYAGSDGKKSTLSKAEVKTLVEKELPGLLQGAKNPNKVDEFMKDLDLNGDSEVDFQEFVMLIGALTCAIHDLVYKQ